MAMACSRGAGPVRKADVTAQHVPKSSLGDPPGARIQRARDAALDDTSVVPDDPLVQPNPRPTSERRALEQQLRLCRLAAAARVADASDEQASARPLAETALSLGGVLKHLAWVEDRWFLGKFLGVDLPEPWASAPLAEEPDWPFESSRSDRVIDLVDLYGAAGARSDSASHGRNLDSLAAIQSFGNGPVNLRWLLVHMINETARHIGHLDLLRDGLGLPPVRR